MLSAVGENDEGLMDDLKHGDFCLLIITVRLIECTNCRRIRYDIRMSALHQMSVHGVE